MAVMHVRDPKTGEFVPVSGFGTDQINAAVNSALEEAKNSGDFKGDPGEPGKDYVLTESDKEEIADIAAEKIELPGGGSGGLTQAQIDALDGMFKVAAYASDAADAYAAFKAAFGVASLLGISAVYSGDSVVVGTDVTTLTGITVTANYSDGKAVTVTDYTITGEIAEGANTLTIGYGGKYTTITVIGVDDGSEPVTMTGITASYTGGDVPVGTALTALTGITVTATYSDGSTATVTGYTLSGEIAEGENTITVSYGTFTSTITVTGYTVVVDEEWTVVRELTNTSIGYIDPVNGELTSSTGDWSASDWIEVPDGATSFSRQTTDTQSWILVWYDENKNYVGNGMSGSYSKGDTYGGGYTDESGNVWNVVPTGVKYCRVSWKTSKTYTSVTFKHNVKLDENVTPEYGKVYYYTYDPAATGNVLSDDYLPCRGMAYAHLRRIIRRYVEFYDASFAKVSTISTANNIGNNVAIPSDAVYIRPATNNMMSTSNGSTTYRGQGLIMYSATELTAW